MKHFTIACSILLLWSFNLIGQSLNKEKGIQIPISTTPVTTTSLCNDPDRYVDNIYPRADIDVLLNVRYSYYMDPLTNRELSLDFYSAKESCPNRPFVVLVHGGGFAAGDKQQQLEQAIAFARKGYAVFAINYRLMGNPSGASPGSVDTTTLCHGGALNDIAWYWAMQDLNAALKHIAYHKNLYHVDPHKAFLYGESAGAITTLQLAYTTEQEVFDTFPGVNFNEHWFLGNLDLTTHPSFRSQTYTIKGVAGAAGALQRDHYLDPNETVPAIMLHNPCDILVNYNVGNNGLGNIFGVPCNRTFYGSKYIYDQMETWSSAPNHELYADCDLYAGIDHGLDFNNMVNRWINNKVGAFFNKSLNNQTSTPVIAPINTTNYCDANYSCTYLSRTNNNAFEKEAEEDFIALVQEIEAKYPTKDVIISNIEKDIILYPNPTSDNATLVLDNWYKKNIQIKVISAIGREILNSEVFVNHLNQKATINLQGKPNGIYIVKIIADNDIKSLKIIKR